MLQILRQETRHIVILPSILPSFPYSWFVCACSTIFKLPRTPDPSYPSSNPLIGHLAVEITSNSTLKPRGTLAQHLRQILQIITSRDTKFAHKVLSSTLQITIIFTSIFLLGSSEVCVRGDGGRSFETLKSLLGFSLGVWVECAFAEELVRGNAFLGAEFLAGVFLFVIWMYVSRSFWIGSVKYSPS